MIMTNDILVDYRNGNTSTTIYQDGTKVRNYDDTTPILVDFPESIDIKITNYCDMGCLYCHESSTRSGVHGDINQLLNTLDVLPKGIELAIGGGNPLSHPNLFGFLEKAKEKGFIVNLTINQGHLKVFKNLILDIIKKDYAKGIGISITNEKNLRHIEPIISVTDNVVYHVIAGVNEVDIIQDLIDLKESPKVLVLGYKTFGFGKEYYSVDVEKNIRKWYMYLPKYLGKATLSFDNLAIEQLNIKRLFTKEGWNKFYMGDDFEFTMYIDAVKQEYSATSRSSQRVNFSEMGLLEFFKNKPVLV